MRIAHSICQTALAFTILATLSGCAIIRDPGGNSVAAVRKVRAEARTRVVPGKLEDVYRRTIETADAAGWEVFRRFPEEHLVVYHQIPGSVDSTQVGVFCSESDGGVLVEVASPSIFSRELAAKILFRRL
ncbi:MAG: hypothetical protein HN849_09300 [Victivallales bacterium]|jgi:hypothetical protein|nr:hypothetical protein [Victivallales bacterium]MBT7299698.1 hypothetical protein [Victivallales bacterium]